MKTGWLINDRLTCIPNTKTFWHDLLEWLPNLQDKTFGYTPFYELNSRIYNELNNSVPDYIIRNATYFPRLINNNIKTISLLQDINQDINNQIDVCNNSNVTIFNSEYTYSFYKDKIKSNIEIIPLGVDFNLFQPSETTTNLTLPNSILFIGSSNENPKGFNMVIDLINNTDYNFTLVMKDDFNIQHERVRVFNKIGHVQLKNIINSCKILICTSHFETLHLAGVEAAACNIPLVCSNVGVYYNKPNSGWGELITVYSFDNYKNAIEKVFNNYNNYTPRKTMIEYGLTKDDCKNRWLNLINNI